MDDMTRNALRLLLVARKEASYRCIKENPDYQELCKQQEKSEKTVNELYKRFNEAEQDIIQDHYEGEGDKIGYEMEEAYIQGLRDCFALFSFLSGKEMSL